LAVTGYLSALVIAAALFLYLVLYILVSPIVLPSVYFFNPGFCGDNRLYKNPVFNDAVPRPGRMVTPVDVMTDNNKNTPGD
jgi:hypothetical protein